VIGKRDQNKHKNKSKCEQGFTQTGELLRRESKDEEQIVHTIAKNQFFH
jgi:hypothetical protein